MKKERNLNLDCLRVMACVAVVGLHTLKADISVFNSIVYYLLGFAVPIFFMASGYILVNRSQITIDYIFHKILNILIVVSLWNVTLFLVKTAYRLYSNSDYHVKLYEPIIMIGKSLIQKDTLWHFWYFGALTLVYLFCFVISKLSKKQKIIVWGIILIISLGIQLGSIFSGSSLQKNIIQTFRVWSWFQYFMLGGFMPKVCQNICSKVKLKWHIIVFSMICIVLPVYQYLVGNYVIYEPHAEYFYDDVLTIIWTVILFTLVMRIKPSEKLKSFVLFLSPYTMGIYIVHPLLIKLAKHFIFIESTWISIIAFVVIFIVSLIVTFVMIRIPVIKRYLVL